MCSFRVRKVPCFLVASLVTQHHYHHCLHTIHLSHTITCHTPSLVTHYPLLTHHHLLHSITCHTLSIAYTPSLVTQHHLSHRFRPSAALFPIVVSQDCGHVPTANAIAEYGTKVTHIKVSNTPPPHTHSHTPHSIRTSVSLKSPSPNVVWRTQKLRLDISRSLDIINGHSVKYLMSWTMNMSSSLKVRLM